MIFDKDRDTVEEGRSRIALSLLEASSPSEALTAKHRRSLQLLYTVGGDLASPRTEAKSTFFSRGGWKLVVSCKRSGTRLEPNIAHHPTLSKRYTPYNFTNISLYFIDTALFYSLLLEL